MSQRAVDPAGLQGVSPRELKGRDGAITTPSKLSSTHSKSGIVVVVVTRVAVTTPVNDWKIFPEVS